ncbi:MAG TPA: MauE/DoxX family redox-associated membrane protein [Verrucomicrobiae bacterium]|nr:MauE/DoxX family redox-associated membrane protein [Verrucomicrobiae bacterium]
MNSEHQAAAPIRREDPSTIRRGSARDEGGAGRLRWYFKSVIFLLVVSGLGKLLSLAGHAKILDAADPVLGLAYRWIMLGSGVAELVLAALIASRFGRQFRTIVVFWIGLAFCSYHGMLALLDPAAPCPCLGTISAQFGLTPKIAGRLALSLAGYFLVGPLAIWAVSRLRKPGEPAGFNALPGQV